MNNLVVAKPEAVLGFMLFRGWKLDDTSKMYYILTKSFKKEQVKFHIPRNTQAEDFVFVINNVVKHLARIYKWDENLLLLFLSMKPEEIDTLFQEWLRSGLFGDSKETNRPQIKVTLSAAS